MASLPPIRRLLIEDFPTQKSWIQPMLLVINNFFESVVGALNKGLTLVDNTTSDVKSVTLSGVPTSTSPVSIAWTKRVAPVAVLVGSVQLVGGSTPTLTSAVQVQWQMNGSALQITNVVGITPTAQTQYVLTLVCIAG